MAENSQNNDQLRVNRAVVSLLEDQLRTQGDYNDIVRDSIELLKKTAIEYSNINKKVDSLLDSEINIQKLQEQKQKSIVKQQVAINRISEIEKSLTQQQISHAQMLHDSIQQRIKAQSEGNDHLADQMQSYIEHQAMNLNVEQQAYAAALSQLELSKHQTKEMEEKIKKEKQLRTTIGLTGGAMKSFADKLGMGSQVYDKLVIKARQLQEQQKDDKGFKNIINGFKNMGSMVRTASGEMASAGLDKMMDPLTMIPMLGGAIAGVVKEQKLY
jgi:hypothetical protein